MQKKKRNLRFAKIAACVISFKLKFGRRQKSLAIPAVNFININRAHFSSEFFAKAKT